MSEEMDMIEERSNLDLANSALHNHMVAAAGIGLIPIPIVDVAAFIGANVLLVSVSARSTTCPLRQWRRARRRASGRGWVPRRRGRSRSECRQADPGAGTAAGMLTLPIANTAFTYAVGRFSSPTSRWGTR